MGLAPVVDAAEEIRRATGRGPNEAWLLAMAAQAPLWHRYAAVIVMTGPPKTSGLPSMTWWRPSTPRAACSNACVNDGLSVMLMPVLPKLSLAERLFPTEDPVREAVLQWTVNRDAADVRRLLTWLPEARSSKEREVLMLRVRGLLDELTKRLTPWKP